MSRPDYVSEEPRTLAPGLADLLADPAHYRRSEMAVVDYSKAAPAPAPPGWEPLLDFKCEPEPKPASLWQRFLAWLTREAGA